MYCYHADTIRVVDGDTLHVRVDLGLDARLDVTLRLAKINAPEMSTERGVKAKEFVVQWLAQHPGRIIVCTIKDRREKYGRYLVEVFQPHPSGQPTGVSLNQALVSHGLAEVYDGG
jgi:micrococcal nuclease